LLDLARIEAGKIELDVRTFDLGQLISEVVDTVGGLLYQKPIALRATLPASLPPARADAGKVRQILLNLLSNAVKFTETGAITITAQCVIMSDEAANEWAIGEADEPAASAGYTTALLARDGRRVTPYLAVSVRDTGIGIAPEHLPLIFEEFRQVAVRRGQKQGSGLGLSICCKLIEAHGGRIWVESTLGQGSTFTFTLPCAIEPKPARRAPSTEDEQIEHVNA
jgi:two-component system sensor histidine kinase/response regulator